VRAFGAAECALYLFGVRSMASARRKAPVKPQKTKTFGNKRATTAHPEKMAIAKKVLRLCPPHMVQSPEVPFLIEMKRAKQKATRVAWP
jgi:hypothetical protein